MSCVDGSRIARVDLIVWRGGRVQSCVRPVAAVHMTAGHNAFRWNGSRSKARARSAMAQTGFPAPGFDRWCITSQLPFPNSAQRCKAAATIGSLYRCPVTTIAQIIPAILLASATAAILGAPTGLSVRVAWYRAFGRSG